MEEQTKILKLMNEVTSRIDLNDFAKSVNSTPKQVLQNMEELSKTDFVRKTGGGYGITEKGRTLLRAHSDVPEGMEFVFYLGIGEPTSLKAKSLKEFYEQIKTADIHSVEFHLYRNDFENWIKAVINDNTLAEEFAKIRATNEFGETLREEILKTIETKYHLSPTG